MKDKNHSKGDYDWRVSNKVLKVSILVLLCISITSIKAQKYFNSSSLTEQQSNYALHDVGTSQPFHDGLAVIIKNGLWGAINTNGNIAIQPQFKSLSKFSNGTAIAETERGHGIVNRNGTFILEPQYDILPGFTKPDAYTIMNKEHNRYGLFYDGKMILPLICTFINDYLFPFVFYGLPNNELKTINVLTGEIFDNSSTTGGLVICMKDTIKYYFTLEGEPIKKEKYKRSSKGVLLFQDDMTKLYGIKDSNGKNLIEAKYNAYDDIWLDDRVLLYDDDNEVVVNSQGKTILSSKKGIHYFSAGKYFWYKDSDNKTLVIYDSSGKKLSKFYGESVYDTGHNEWFRIKLGNDKDIAYDIRHNKQYKDIKSVTYKEGVIELYKEDGTHFYYNADTGKEIAGPLKYAWGFHEGLAVVQRVGAQYYEVIDINGRVLMRSSNKYKIGNYFSEGVISVEENNVSNYIYNPLGHKDYVYNQSTYSDRTIARWNKLGHEAFDNKQYATAKDYFYKVMMNDPTNVSAVINYGAALGNMGYYDEAIESCRIALDIDPDNQLAKDNLRINLDNKKKEEERQQQAEEEEREERSTKSSTFWDALGNFANILSSIAGGENVYQPYSSFSMDADYSPSYSNSGRSNHDYQSEYNRWANLAERHYNSLTNLGYRVKHKGGSRSGGTLSSMSGSKYVQMKKSLRDAQHEMQRIRRKAAQNGVTITPSTWESATVGY